MRFYYIFFAYENNFFSFLIFILINTFSLSFFLSFLAKKYSSTALQLALQDTCFSGKKRDQYFKLRKKWKEHASKRISSVGFASPRGSSFHCIFLEAYIFSSSSRLLYSSSSLFHGYSLFLSTSLCVYISSVDAVECDKVEFQHMVLFCSRAHAISVLFSSLFWIKLYREGK